VIASARKHGGAAVWQTPAVDPDLGLIHFSTANPGPVLNGRLRRGDNLFSASIHLTTVHELAPGGIARHSR